VGLIEPPRTARWLTEKAEKPEGVRASDWLDYEQQKHQRLLAA
jgi:hypothetical protein